MLEKDIQKTIVSYLKSRNIVAYKIDSTSRRGLPDLLCVGHGDVFMIEVKTEKGRLSKLQVHAHKEITEHGGKVFVARNIQDVAHIIKEVYAE